MKTKHLGLILLVPMYAACGSTYTLIDRSDVPISANARTSARTLLPSPDRHPALVEHLALAQEIYQKQIRLLRERRNKTRARKRDLNFAAYGIMSATALGVSGLAIGSVANDSGSQGTLVGAGVLSLTGLGIGTILQLTAAMQEEPSVPDEKTRTLQRMYENMLDRVRFLGKRTPENPDEAAQLQAQIASVIETFISDAIQINVKG